MLKIYDMRDYLENSIAPVPLEFIRQIENEIKMGIKIGLLSAFPVSYMQGIATAIGIKDILLIGDNGDYICGDANIPPQWHCTGSESNFMECISQKSGIRLESIVIHIYQ